MAGRGPKKVSDYGLQLKEKQNVRNNYGMREAQFRRFYGLATKFKGQTGQKLLEILETRLDNVIFRGGLALSRAQARQNINHRHFLLNGKRINIPSILVKTGDVIEPYHKNIVVSNPNVGTSDWLKVDKKTSKITVLRAPEAMDLPQDFDTQKIVEFYSR